MKIAKIAYIRARVGQELVLKQALIELERVTRLEAGCVFFSFYQSLSNTEGFVLIECFASNKALEQHMQLPHTLHFFSMNLVEDIMVSEIAEANLPTKFLPKL